MKSSEEYKLFDSERIRELSKKYHLNVSKEKQTLNQKISPYLQIIKFCYEHQYEDLSRKEIQSLLSLKKDASIGFIKNTVQKNPILFESYQKKKYGKDSLYYLRIKDMNRLKQEYQKYF